jgi:hypothetical protein
MRITFITAIPLLFLVAAAPDPSPTLLKPAATQPATQEWSGEYNDTPTTSEADSLSDIVQLTTGSARAGEAYFSPDMNWIIFQSAAKKEDQYQMFVAKQHLRLLFPGWQHHHFRLHNRQGKAG